MADSIREALTSAIDKAEKPADSAGPITDNAPADDSVTPGPAERDEAVAPISATEKVGEESVVPKATDAAGKPSAAPISPAPASWTKEEREAWATVPEGARKAVMRRESEMQRAFQTSAGARKRVEQFDAVAAPYKPLLDRYGISLEQALPPLLATRAALEVATPAQKATLVANICADFGIPIELLDTALVQRFQGGVPQPQQPPIQPDLSQNPALAPLFAFAEQVKAAQTERAQQAIDTVQSNPHYDEVRFTMADLIDKSRQQGRSLDLSRAYQLACSLHGFDDATPAPAATSVSEAAAILARSRTAASSVTGAPKPTPARKPGEGSVADEITALMSARR